MSFSDDDEGDVPPLLSAPPPGVRSIPPVPVTRKPAAPAAKPAPVAAATVAAPAVAAAAATASPKPAAVALKPSSVFPVRSKVRLHGLTGRADLNGCTGEVAGPPAENGRIPVRLGAPHDQRIALKPENLEIIKEELLRKNADADPLRLPAVQQSMEEQQASAGAAQVGGGAPGWVTPDLLQKVAADPLLRKAFTDPKCAAAMTALQQDPKKAMETYADVPEMREFLQKFMKLMGDHFTALGAAQPAAPPPAPAIQPVLSPEEEAARKAVQDPEVAAILADPQVQQILQKLQMGRAHEVERSMAHPEMVRKLQRLAQAGLIGMHWER